MLVQIALFYGMAGALKHGHDIWMRGDALAVFLGIEHYRTPLGAVLLDYPALTRALTLSTLALELAAPVLLLCPLRGHITRSAAILLLVGMHVGIQATVHIGIFELTSIAALLALVPPSVWSSGAGRRVRAQLDRLWAGPGTAGDGVPSGSPPPPLSEPLGTRLVVGCLLSVVVWSNAESLTGHRTALPYPLAGPAYALNLQQRWEIFTGIDSIRQGWFFALGETAEGRQVNVLTGATVAGPQRPADASAMFPNHNDRRYWTLLALKKYAALRPGLATYLCRQWRTDHGASLRRIGILHVGRWPHEDRDTPRMLIKQPCPQ